MNTLGFLLFLAVVSTICATRLPDGCHPYYRWEGCDHNETYIIETTAKCDPPKCTIRCTNSTEVHYCTPPKCEIVCPQVATCELEDCPVCSTLCAETVCKPASGLCETLCEPLDCAWDYALSVTSDDAPEDGCSLQAFEPFCSYTQDISEWNSGSGQASIMIGNSWMSLF